MINGMREEMAKDMERKKLYSLLGQLPDKQLPITSILIGKEERKNFIIERLLLDLDGFEQVPAYFVSLKTQIVKIQLSYSIIHMVGITTSVRMNY